MSAWRKPWFFRWRREAPRSREAEDDAGRFERADELSRCLESPPTWLAGRGLGIISGAFMAALLVLLALPFPESVDGEVTVRSTDPPEILVAPAAGRIVQLWRSEGDKVQADDWILAIESDGDLEAVLAMKRYLRRLQQVVFDPRFLGLRRAEAESFKEEISLHTPVSLGGLGSPNAELERLDDTYSLGSLQSPAAALTTSLAAYLDFVASERLSDQVSAVRRSMRKRRTLNRAYTRREQLADEGLKLTEDWIRADTKLAEAGVLAKREVDEERLAAQARRREALDERVSATLNSVAMADVAGRLAAVEQSRFDRRQELVLRLRQDLLEATGAFDAWTQRFVVRARRSGTLAGLRDIGVGIYLQESEELAAIIPSDQALVGYISVGQLGIGRVDVGQTAQVHFTAYPALRFGFVEAEVSRVAPITTDGNYLVELAFTELTTHTREHLVFRQGLKGQARIIIEERTLFERVLSPLRYMWHRNRMRFVSSPSESSS